MAMGFLGRALATGQAAYLKGKREQQVYADEQQMQQSKLGLEQARMAQEVAQAEQDRALRGRALALEEKNALVSPEELGSIADIFDSIGRTDVALAVRKSRDAGVPLNRATLTPILRDVIDLSVEEQKVKAAAEKEAKGKLQFQDVYANVDGFNEAINRPANQAMRVADPLVEGLSRGVITGPTGAASAMIAGAMTGMRENVADEMGRIPPLSDKGKDLLAWSKAREARKSRYFTNVQYYIKAKDAQSAAYYNGKPIRDVDGNLLAINPKYSAEARANLKQFAEDVNALRTTAEFAGQVPGLVEAERAKALDAAARNRPLGEALADVVRTGKVDERNQALMNFILANPRQMAPIIGDGVDPLALSRFESSTPKWQKITLPNGKTELFYGNADAVENRIKTAVQGSREDIANKRISVMQQGLDERVRHNLWMENWRKTTFNSLSAKDKEEFAQGEQKIRIAAQGASNDYNNLKQIAMNLKIGSAQIGAYKATYDVAKDEYDTLVKRHYKVDNRSNEMAFVAGSGDEEKVIDRLSSLREVMNSTSSAMQYASMLMSNVGTGVPAPPAGGSPVLNFSPSVTYALPGAGNSGSGSGSGSGGDTGGGGKRRPTWGDTGPVPSQYLRTNAIRNILNVKITDPNDVDAIKTQAALRLLLTSAREFDSSIKIEDDNWGAFLRFLAVYMEDQKRNLSDPSTIDTMKRIIHERKRYNDMPNASEKYRPPKDLEQYKGFINGKLVPEGMPK